MAGIEGDQRLAESADEQRPVHQGGSFGDGASHIVGPVEIPLPVEGVDCVGQRAEVDAIVGDQRGRPQGPIGLERPFDSAVLGPQREQRAVGDRDENKGPGSDRVADDTLLGAFEGPGEVAAGGIQSVYLVVVAAGDNQPGLVRAGAE